MMTENRHIRFKGFPRSQPKLTIRKMKKESFISRIFEKKPLKTADIARLTRQFSTMLSSGIPLTQSFEIIMHGSKHTTLNNLILSIKIDVKSGIKFSSALMKHPHYFSRLYCALVEAGEESGTLAKMLEKLANYMEKIESIKRKIKKALFYPTAIIVIGLVVSTILLLKVIPEFKSLFSDFGAKLPTFTTYVLNFSEWMEENFLKLIIGIIVFVFLSILSYKKSRSFHRLIDKYKLKIPVVGIILTKNILARFTRTLATTFSAGMPLTEALKIVSRVSDNLVYEEAIEHTRHQILEGQSLHTSLESENIFPIIMLQMIAIGEESGALDKMLNKTAEIYEEEVDNAVDGLSSLIEPLIMSILGILIGSLVIAMYLPIFQLSDVIGR